MTTIKNLPKILQEWSKKILEKCSFEVFACTLEEETQINNNILDTGATTTVTGDKTSNKLTKKWSIGKKCQIYAYKRTSRNSETFKFEDERVVKNKKIPLKIG